jgi:hypothetical protein
LLATQAIRGGANRRVLEQIKTSGDIFWAISDRDWILNGAAVHVSMVGFDSGNQTDRMLDGEVVETIHADLSSGVATVAARRLPENQGRSFMGDTKGGPFDLPFDEVGELLTLPNPHGRPNSDVLIPWVNGVDLTRRPRGMWIVDFGLGMLEHEATLYEAPYEHIRSVVWPARARSRSTIGKWWLHERAREEMREAIAPQERYLATARVTKHRLFSWLPSPTLPDSATFVFADSTDQFLGVLHSRLHEVWALAQGTQLEDRPRYTPTSCFETFPFPSIDASIEAVIGEAAAELDRLRRAWLNPPEWTHEEVLEFPGSVDGPWKRFVHEPDARGIGTVRWPRVVAKDAECAKKLVKRTLTNLYNERPAWLDLAHKRLDEAVFAAYGWPPDLTDEQILKRLLALNLERAAGQN